MIIIFLYIILFILLNFILFRVYSNICKYKYLNRINNNLNSIKENKKTYLKSLLYRYLNGYVRYSLRIIGSIPSHRFRNFIYKQCFLMNLGKNAVIYGGAEIRAPWNITIGDNTIIGDEAKLDGRNSIIIGNNVNFSTGVWIWTDQHNVNSETFDSLDPALGKVIIEDRVWLGPRTMILPGKIIQEGAVVAGGAVVTKNLESFTIYAGIPAKKIGARNKNLKYEFPTSSYLPFF